MHLPAGSVDAHRDLHFRLLRFNLVADIQTSIKNLNECGGLKGLQKTVGGIHDRVHVLGRKLLLRIVRRIEWLKEKTSEKLTLTSIEMLMSAASRQTAGQASSIRCL